MVIGVLQCGWRLETEISALSRISIIQSPLSAAGRLLPDDAEDVGLGDEQMLFAVDLHFGAAVFGNENDIAHLYGKLDSLAVFVFSAGAEGHDLCLLGFFLRGIRQVNTAGGLVFAFNALHENALSERLDFGGHSVVFLW